MSDLDNPALKAMYDESVAFENVQSFGRLVNEIANHVAEKAKEGDLNITEACQATANGVMQLLDGRWQYAPRFILTPVPCAEGFRPTNRQLGISMADEIRASPNDREYVQRVHDEFKRDNAEGWNYHQPLQTAETPHPYNQGSFGQAHADAYDEDRERLMISAKDLFD